MSERFFVEGDRLTSEDALIDLVSVAKEGDFSSDLVPWIETLSDQHRRILWGIMYMTKQDSRERMMFHLWSDKAHIDAAARALGAERLREEGLR